MLRATTKVEDFDRFLKIPSMWFALTQPFAIASTLLAVTGFALPMVL
jgi:hypothetical protein